MDITQAPDSAKAAAPRVEAVAAAGVACTAASAQLFGWLTVAALNQVLIAVVLPSAPGKVLVLHHAYDAGQLVAAGVLSWLAVRGAQRLAARWAVQRRIWQAALLGVVVFAIGLATASGDVANFAERTGASRPLMTVVAALASALVLGATRLLSGPRQLMLRAGQALAGVGLVVVNGLLLEADYFACHMMVAWLGALLIANAMEGLTALRWRWRSELGAVAVLGVAGGLAVAVAPAGDVRIRMYSLPSSVFAPMLARFLPRANVATALVPERYRDSPWFGNRSPTLNVPASRALVPAQPPIVMLFTVDALRADVVEEAQHLKKLPAFAQLRETSSYFSKAHAPTTSTMTTMASVFTGKYYSQLRWQRGKTPPLVEPTARFPELLQRAGVMTAAFSGGQGRIHAHTGVALGFTKDVVVPAGPKPARNNVDAIIAELEASSNGPLFVYAHFIEPHGPYTLAGKNGTAFERYFREVAMVDRELGRLRSYLEDKGLAERTYLLISADHGEAFGEHASFGHAKTVYEEQARVPLFFHAPGREGRAFAMPVTLMDAGPTILDLFGLPTPGWWMGQSLLPVVMGSKAGLERPVALDTGRRMQAFLFDDGYKVIFNRDKQTTEVFDLKADPLELQNLASSGDLRVQQAIQTAELFFLRIRVGAEQEAAPGLDE